MNDWVIFGAGANACFSISLLRRMGLSPRCILDNDETKWKLCVEGVEICAPEKIENDCNVFISCSDREPIIRQLITMGVSEGRIFDYNKLLSFYVEGHDFKSININGKWNSTISGARKIIIDAYDGIGWGGMEVWSYRVAKGLQSAGYDVVICGSLGQEETDYEYLIKRFPFDKENGDHFWDAIEIMAEEMLRNLPIIVINNWSNHVLAAAIMIKKAYPEAVKIITMVHNDMPPVYKSVEKFCSYMDSVICVSERIRNNFVERNVVPKYKLYSKVNFVIDIAGQAERRKTNEPVRIGWAGRLEITQKRVDLFYELIRRLENLEINYILEVAGNGPLYNELSKWVSDNDLDNKVFIYGLLTGEEMKKFWNKQHIYINFSEYEGSSLAMLEAMAQGIVPVVTAVSGTRDVVVNDQNGYIVECGDMDAMVSRIEYLFKNEDVRYKMADAALKSIRSKCVFKDYIVFMEEKFW